jgi:hypothetical protein
MARLQLRLFVACFLCVFGFASFAQNASSPPNVDPSTGAASKAPGKKNLHKQPGTAARLTLQPPNEEAEKAARLAEGRKKFFEQSSGFENKGSSSPFTADGAVKF